MCFVFSLLFSYHLSNFRPSDEVVDAGIDLSVVWMWAMDCVDFRTRNELNLSERRDACTMLRLNNCIPHKYRIRQTVV